MTVIALRVMVFYWIWYVYERTTTEMQYVRSLIKYPQVSGTIRHFIEVNLTTLHCWSSRTHLVKYCSSLLDVLRTRRQLLIGKSLMLFHNPLKPIHSSFQDFHLRPIRHTYKVMARTIEKIPTPTRIQIKE